MAAAEKRSSHQADDGQIDLEFTEEAQEVTLEDVSEESSAPEVVEEENLLTTNISSIASQSKKESTN